MSDYAHDESSPPRHGSDANLQNSLDDSSNNSIIGKVKSRVSSILPNRLSKWFSPSAKLQNDSLNGSMSGGNNTLPTRRRRRIEIEEDEEDENYEDDNDAERCGEYEESNHMSYPKQVQSPDRNLNVDANDDDDDDSQNSEEECIDNSIKETRSNLNVAHQPPAKRSRLNIEVRDSPIIARHQPLLSSTPAVGNAYMRNAATSAARPIYERYTHLNLYGNQSKREPAFNFGPQRETNPITKSNTDIIDLITNPTYEQEDRLTNYSNVYGCNRTAMGSRKSLNIPSTSTLIASDRAYATISNLKRQPLSSAKPDLSPTNMMGEPPRSTSTTIHEVEDQITPDNEQNHHDGREKGDYPISNTHNGSVQRSNHCDENRKRRKLINGTGSNTTIIPENSEGILIDSASESGESAMEVIKLSTPNTPQRKTGLFNMSAGGTANTRNSSRTSSFGNGLNFYSHLEGQKSLFSGLHHGNLNPLNNSTLSLTSLNRRQFNASIYGSTSALSDSRLLNTFSPFYKGKTTYGGASAYNKYTVGTGASAMRITPTLIRPTSSLSALSSLNSSLATNVNSHVGENSTISTTAKRILDLINDFATPLSEAKKMASNLKTNPSLQITPQVKRRLNESELNASRAIRLSQVRTPYSRPSVTLQPSGNASGRGVVCNILPPVKELQVPTMSQLLQMKKMQNTTENVRKIAQNSACSATSENTLPNVISSKNSNYHYVFEKDQPKHTNKIKRKISDSLRPSAASEDLQNEETPFNLPTLAFPLMESMPKIDIQINKSLTSGKSNSSQCKSSKLPSILESSNLRAFNVSSATSLTPTTQISAAANNNKIDQLPTVHTNSTKSSHNFTFSEPLQILGFLAQTQIVSKNEVDKYKFSSPLDVKVALPTSNCFKIHNTQPKQPQLRDGSCLDDPSKPFALPPIGLSKPNVIEQTPTNKTSLSSSGFGSQFKQASNEWECDVCMVRNKLDVNKCVACETTRKSDSSTFKKSALAPSPSFGQQFKKSSNEWECDTCMIRNKEEMTKCIACETPHKGGLPPSTVALQTVKNSFGDAFKPKLGTWECQTCMITNKNELSECIACQTKKPGSSVPSQSVVPTSQFKFGFAADGNKISNSADESLKTLVAQQKVSKWKCDVCMTRNDANRTKCANCEQLKPGLANVELTNATTSKFILGATAASKFSFGFGTGQNAPKEEDLRKELSTKSEVTEKQSSTQLGLSTSQAAPTLGGFQFGVKSTAGSTSETKKDETDSNKLVSGFKFGVVAPPVELNKNDKSAVPLSSAEFAFGSKSFSATKPTTSTPTLSSTVAANTTSVKFSLPSSTDCSINNKPESVALPALGFATSIASPTTEVFPFGNKIKTTSDDKGGEKKISESINFKASATVTPTKTSGFAFGSPSVNSSTTAPASFVSSTFNTTASTAAVTTTSATTASVKPMFSLGKNTLTTVASTNSQATPAFSSFSFGSNPKDTAATTASANTLFAAVTSTSTLTTTAASASTKSLCLSTSSSTTTTTPASTNIFGSLVAGANLSNASVSSPIFGSSVNPPANNNLSTVSSSTNNPILSNTSHFGVFGSKTTSNVFGSFGGAGGGVETKQSALVKPNDTKPKLPIFGNLAPTSTSQSSQSNSSGFVFGSNTAEDKEAIVTTTVSVTSTSTTWPKNSFVFGSTAAAAAAPANKSENKEAAKSSLFGTFGSCSTKSTNQQQSASIFGGPLAASSTTTLGLTSNSSTNLFGTNAAAPATTSIFGATSSGNAATPTPAFGSSSFGGAASSTSATPTFGSTAASGTNFGSTAASGTTFGSFGGSSSNITTNTKTDVKKPETAFSFGAASTNQSTSGGFNFGSSASTTKPAFNFGGTSTTQQPTFNFTGTTESQSSSKPFQFGATPSAPVFNFNRGVLEGTPNAPFQFNAGAAPVSSNIFAPPAAAPGAQTAQQAKRKIRAPLRRVTQR